MGRLAQHGLAGRRKLLEALSEVDRVTYERVLGALRTPDQGCRDQASGQADAELKGWQSRRLPSPIQLDLSSLDGIGGTKSAVGVICLWLGGTEDCHHRVTHELHDGPTLRKDRVTGDGPVLVQLTRKLARVGRFSDRRVAPDI